MSVATEATEIERHSAHLSTQLEDEPPYTVHGIAIGEGDITRGSSGIEKKWPREALKPAAETLAGRPLVVDHENESHAVVGKVTEAFYKDDVGVLYEAELFDEELAEKIANGLLEVSIRGFHGDVSEMDESDEGAKVVDKLRFDNLSIVPMGAAPSNTVRVGGVDEIEDEELTGDECAELIESAELSHTAPDDSGESVEQAADAPDWSEGQMVQWQVNPDMLGKIVHVDEEKNILMVEVMEEEDGDMQSSGFTVTAGYGDLVPAEEEELRQENEGAEEDRRTDTDRYSQDIERYPEGDNTPPEDDEGMHEGPDEEDYFQNEEGSGDNMDEEELQELSTHEVSFDGTRDGDWTKPDLTEFMNAMDADAESWGDLTEEQQNQVASHFLVSKSGFPPENFGDLALPVVETDGQLNLNALQNAKARAGQVSGLSGDTLGEVENMIDGLANENFDATFGEDEEEMQHAIDVVRSTRTAFEFADGRIVSVDGDGVEELRSRTELREHGDMDVPEEHMFEDREDAMDKAEDMDLDGVHEMDGMWVPGSTHEEYMQATSDEEEEMSSNDDASGETAEAEAGEGSEPDTNASEEELSENESDTDMTDDNTVEIDEDELEELRSKAEEAEEREEELEELREGFSEDLAELKERTAVLDEADRDQVDQLAEADDPVVVESEKFEELEESADQAREAYAAALSEYTGPAVSEEDLAERYTISELRERLEEQLDEEDEVEEELTPDPKSEDPESEEELEEASGEAEEEEELEEEAAEKQEELRAKMGL